MTMTPEFAAAIDPLLLGLVTLLIVLVAWLLWRQSSLLSELREDRIRTQTREEDRRMLEEGRGRAFDDRLRDLDIRLNEGQANTRTLLERRLGEAQSHQIETEGKLRTELVERFDTLQKSVGDHLADGRTQTVRAIGDLREQINTALGNHQTRFEQRQGDAIKALQETLQSGMQVTQKQVADALTRSAEEVGKRVEALTRDRKSVV